MPKFQDLLCVSVAAAAGDAQSGLLVVVSSVDTPLTYLSTNDSLHSINASIFIENGCEHTSVNQINSNSTSFH